MKNKKLLSKFVLTAFTWLCFSISFGSAEIHFNLNLSGREVLTEGNILDNMMYVHFADNGNNFGGFMYFSNGVEGKSNEGEFFEIGTEAHESLGYECLSQIKGFYYNAERGDRLWPLDQDTWSGVLLNSGLVTTGGIYTSCQDSGYMDALSRCREADDYNVCVNEVNEDYSTDQYGYYGSVEQTYSGQEMNLIMGVEYDTRYSQRNFHFIPIKPRSDLSPTFVRINNRYPVGFIYDYNGGVGLAGCRFDSVIGANYMKNLVEEAQSTGLSNIFIYKENAGGTGELVYSGKYTSMGIKCDGVTAEDSLVKIIVEGIMGLDDDGGEGSATKFGSMGNSTDTKMQYFATKSVNNITMINHARRKAESLCRGKWITNFDVDISSQQIVCLIADDTMGPIDAHNDALNGKTLIVKGGADVKITPSTGWEYDIFVDGGDLLVEEDGSTEQVVIKNNGFISDTSINTFYWRALYDYFGVDYVKLQSYLLRYSNGEPCDSYCIKWKEVLDINGDGIIRIDDITTYFDIIYEATEGVVDLGDDVAIASVLRGNFIVDGNIMRLDGGEENGDKLKNKYFIYGKLTTKDDLDSLEETFSWRCRAGLANDDSFCPGKRLPDYPNPYQNAALVIIDQNYNSPLLKS